MRKILWIAVASAVVLSLGFFISGNEEAFREDFADKNKASDNERGFVVYAENEYVALYKIEAGKKELLKKKEYMPMRESDLELLREGIRAESLEEALVIFEDFIS